MWWPYEWLQNLAMTETRENNPPSKLSFHYITMKWFETLQLYWVNELKTQDSSVLNQPESTSKDQSVGINVCIKRTFMLPGVLLMKAMFLTLSVPSPETPSPRYLSVGRWVGRGPYAIPAVAEPCSAVVWGWQWWLCFQQFLLLHMSVESHPLHSHWTQTGRAMPPLSSSIQGIQGLFALFNST